MTRPKMPLFKQRLCYHRSQAQARFRREPWAPEFTFEEWWRIWQPRWSDRGTYRHCVIMCRVDTDLPWHQDNVALKIRRDWLSENSQRGR
jgi:hypothetical protein